jgi:hypothetical protein
VPWVLLGLGLAVSGLVVLVVAGLVVLAMVGNAGSDDAAGLQDARLVLSEDFTWGSGSFDEYADETFTARAVDGAYVITSEDLQYADWVTAFVPRADAVDVRARVALAEDAEPTAEAGVTVEGDQGGYAFTVSGGSGALISRITAGGMDVVTEGEALPDPSGEVRLTVEPSSAGGTLVRGYLDGRLVAEHEDSARVGGFTEVGLAVYADSAPVTARFDDLVVRVAGEG